MFESEKSSTSNDSISNLTGVNPVGPDNPVTGTVFKPVISPYSGVVSSRYVSMKFTCKTCVRLVETVQDMTKEGYDKLDQCGRCYAHSTRCHVTFIRDCFGSLVEKEERRLRAKKEARRRVAAAA